MTVHFQEKINDPSIRILLYYLSSHEYIQKKEDNEDKECNEWPKKIKLHNKK